MKESPRRLYVFGGFAVALACLAALAALYGATWIGQNIGVSLRYGAFTLEMGDILKDPMAALSRGIALEIPATVSNRTFLPIALEDVWFGVYVNDELIAEGEAELPASGAELSGGDKLDLELRTRIAAARAGSLPVIIAAQRKLEVAVEGVATVSVFGFEIERDFRVTGVDLLLQPRIEW